MKKDKEKVLEIVIKKVKGEEEKSYEEIGREMGYSKRQLIRLSKEIKKRDISSILKHGNSGKVPSNKAENSELNYIIELKKKYLSCSITQFRDIYHEDVIWNREKTGDVINYNLKIRSYSFFEILYHKKEWIIPREHKSFNKESITHPLREPSPRAGLLVIIDGTPHDWFDNGKKQALHLAIDDANGEFAGGWFMANECLEGYCHLLYLIITKKGIPANLYFDKHTIFKSPKDGSLTTFGKICEELGINMIYAGTPQAKGKIEKGNDTIQQRLINDIKRFNIKTVEELNEWFNSFYIDYLNKKFAYKPKEEESEYVEVEERIKGKEIEEIFVTREKRTILNGNCISYKSSYYVPVDASNQVVAMYKGSNVEVRENILNKTIKIFKNNKLYNVRKINYNEENIELRQLIVHNQKELKEAIDKSYKTNEEKKKKIQEIIDKNSLEEKRIRDKIEARNILRGAGKSHKKKWY